MSTLYDTREVTMWGFNGRRADFDRVFAMPGDPIFPWLKLDRATLEDEANGLGKRLIDEAHEHGFKVFADAKLVEVPVHFDGPKDGDGRLLDLYLPHKPEVLNCMFDVFSTGIMDTSDPNMTDGLKRFADRCHAAGVRPCAVILLTSKKEDMVKRIYGRTVEEVMLDAMQVLLEADFSDVVCAPTDVESIRADLTFNQMRLITPGVRLPGTDHGSQSRVDTPRASLEAGADHLVIVSNIDQNDLEGSFARLDAHLNPKE